LLSLITPENLPHILTAVGTILGGGGILTWWRVRREPPKPGSQDAATLALAENTQATRELVAAVREMVVGMKTQNTHFADNNDMFRAIGGKVEGMAKDFSDIKHDTSESKGHLSAMRDALNRLAR
jgi:hypothetical protein